jgi:hypothetical protein
MCICLTVVLWPRRARLSIYIYVDHCVYLIIVLGDSTLITASARGHYSAATAIDLPDGVLNCRMNIHIGGLRRDDLLSAGDDDYDPVSY